MQPDIYSTPSLSITTLSITIEHASHQNPNECFEELCYALHCIFIEMPSVIMCKLRVAMLNDVMLRIAFCISMLSVVMLSYVMLRIVA